MPWHCDTQDLTAVRCGSPVLRFMKKTLVRPRHYWYGRVSYNMRAHRCNYFRWWQCDSRRQARLVRVHEGPIIASKRSKHSNMSRSMLSVRRVHQLSCGAGGFRSCRARRPLRVFHMFHTLRLSPCVACVDAHRPTLRRYGCQLTTPGSPSIHLQGRDLIAHVCFLPRRQGGALISSATSAQPIARG